MSRIFPIYLFTGDDDYLKRESAHKLREALLGKNESEAFNFNTYDAVSCDIKEVINVLRSAPFISNKRLVLLKNIDAASRETRQAITRYAVKPSKSSCLILESSKKKLSAAFYKEIIKQAREISFELPRGNRITGWIQKEVKARGRSISYDAALLLKELKRDDTGGLRCEMDKLVTYAGKRSGISRQDVENLIGSSVSRSVFEFVDALGRKNAKDAISIAREMLRAKKAVPEILGMVGWQLRQMKKAGAYNKRDTSEIDASVSDLLDADYSIKKGYLKSQEALEAFIIKTCAAGK